MISIHLPNDELMGIQAETLYVLDEQERIVAINEPLEMQPPAVFIGTTTEGTVIRFRQDLPQALIDELLRMTADSLDIVQLCRVIERSKKVTDIWIGPAYAYQNGEASNEREPDVLLIDESNRHLLKKHFPFLHDELSAHVPAVGYMLNGEVVSVCCSARRSAKAAEASLKTIDACRGRGMAPRVVKAWCEEVSRAGLLPLYSTSWDNVSSQKVAQKLGLRPYGMDFNISTE